MPEPPQVLDEQDAAALRAEIVRLNKIIDSLINRAERSANANGSDYSLFQATVLLEDQVRRRTQDLEAALRDNESITRSLYQSEERYRSMVTQSLVGVALVEDERFTYVNPAILQTLGYSAIELLKIGPVAIVVEEDQHTARTMLQQRMRGELQEVHHTFAARCKDGRVVTLEIHGSTMRVDGTTTLVNLVIDITERRRAEREVLALQEQLREQSIRDPLTGLHNRRYMEDALERELLVAQRQGKPVSVVIVDVDHFKSINDRHGHLAGDEVLRGVAETMKRLARASDIFCRYGGEEFLLVLPGLAADEAGARAEKIRQALAATPIESGQAAITLTASFGVAACPLHGQSAEELVARADQALYQAKRGGRDQVRQAEP